MAEASLNFNEDELKKDEKLYELYLKYYNGMVSANDVTPPDYTTSPPLTESGEIDVDAIANGLKAYSDILIKNSAYLMSTAIQFALGGSIGGGGDEGGEEGSGYYILRTGDAMTGKLEAKYGFIAGTNGISQFIVDTSKAEFLTPVFISKENLSINEGKLLFGNQVELSYATDNLNITGNLIIDSNYSLILGNSKINKDGVYVSDNLVYHAGNANLSTVDWNMRNANVSSKLTVQGNTDIYGVLCGHNGFDFRYNEDKLLGIGHEGEATYINLYTDLIISPTFGIKSGDKYILKKYTGTNDYLCLSAPGSVIHLGGSDGNSNTQAIILKSDIYNYSQQYKIVSQNGDGNFPNSLSAGCANAGPTVLRTYYTSTDDCGVEFARNIRIGENGATLHSNDRSVIFGFPSSFTGVSQNHEITMSVKEVTTLFTPSNTATAIQYRSTADLIAFISPVQAAEIQIASNKYKTRIIENTFFFNDGVFLEGVVDGIRFSGNSYFDGNLTSRSFSSGMLGYGFGIIQNEALGGIEAHFDGLVVRKKMRVYELEVQKQSVVNGSWWVSNSCSGDIVEELN